MGVETLTTATQAASAPPLLSIDDETDEDIDNANNKELEPEPQPSPP